MSASTTNRYLVIQRCFSIFFLGLAFLFLCCSAPAVRGAAAHSLIANGDFERPDMRLTRSEQENTWGFFIHGNSDARITLAGGQGRGGSRGVRYTRTTAGSDNAHLDQIFAVESNTTWSGVVSNRGGRGPRRGLVRFQFAEVPVG